MSIYLQPIHLLAYISCYGLAAENFHLFSFRLHSHPLPLLPPRVCDFHHCILSSSFLMRALSAWSLKCLGPIWLGETEDPFHTIQNMG